MRPMEGPTVGASTKCPQCATDVAAGEKFCAACGAGIAVVDGGVIKTAEPLPPPIVVGLDNYERDARIGKARKWLMAISIITLLSGFVFYFINKEEVEKDIREAETAVMGADPEAIDAHFKQEMGMTFSEAKAHQRGLVNLLLWANIGLAIVYLGMWYWAKRNALAASVTALLLFITVIGVNAVYEPKTLAQGFIVKIFFIAALAKAITAAQEERKLQAQMPRATIA
jgi:uncharacterized membrane protein